MQTKSFYLSALRKAVEIRATEKLIAKDFMESKIFSFLHLSIGQEAAAVGVAMALESEDLMFGNHRSHGHYLAKGGNYDAMIREIYGDSGGCCHGIGGSMHMLDRSVGFVGSTPILGSVAPLAVGVSVAKKMNQIPGIVVAYVGDGAAEEGAFYESVNLAGLFKAPLLYVIEDNRYAVNSTHGARKAAGYHFKNIFEGLGAIYERVDGQNVRTVFEVTKELRSKILEGKKIAVLHLDVLREYGHSGPVPEGNADYRDVDDADYRKEKDCIEHMISQLISLGEKESEVRTLVTECGNAVKDKFNAIRSTIEIRI